MAIKVINFEDQKLLIKLPTQAEKKALKKLPTKHQYRKLLGYIINKDIAVNDFVGSINRLQSIIEKIKEAI